MASADAVAGFRQQREALGLGIVLNNAGVGSPGTARGNRQADYDRPGYQLKGVWPACARVQDHVAGELQRHQHGLALGKATFPVGRIPQVRRWGLTETLPWNSDSGIHVRNLPGLHRNTSAEESVPEEDRAHLASRRRTGNPQTWPSCHVAGERCPSFVTGMLFADGWTAI